MWLDTCWVRIEESFAHIWQKFTIVKHGRLPGLGRANARDNTSRRMRQGHRAVGYFIALMVGAIHERAKSVISGNCATIRPIAGTPTKLRMRSQKCAPNWPGTVLVM